MNVPPLPSGFVSRPFLLLCIFSLFTLATGWPTSLCIRAHSTAADLKPTTATWTRSILSFTIDRQRKLQPHGRNQALRLDEQKQFAAFPQQLRTRGEFLQLLVNEVLHLVPGRLQEIRIL